MKNNIKWKAIGQICTLSGFLIGIATNMIDKKIAKTETNEAIAKEVKKYMKNNNINN